MDECRVCEDETVEQQLERERLRIIELEEANKVLRTAVKHLQTALYERAAE
jgi:hypothetical protein